MHSYDKDKYMALLIVIYVCAMLLIWSNIFCVHKVFCLPDFFRYYITP